MSSAKVTVRARAVRDLLGHAEWLRNEADDELADRFLFAARSSFAALAQAPGLGALSDARSPELRGARKWRVEGFPNRLIFYAPRPAGGVTILRVLHAARDWRSP